MEFQGAAALEGTREEVWNIIFDPDMLKHLIPGCQDLEQASADEYRGTIRIGVAAVAGEYEVLVKVTDQTPPERCRLNGRIQGSAGIITGNAELALKPSGPACTMEYLASATISGPLSSLSPRLVEGVAKKLIDQGINNFNHALEQHKKEGSEPSEVRP